MLRRRAVRLLRSVDQYLVFAAVGVVFYIIAVNVIAETLAIGLRRVSIGYGTEAALRPTPVVVDEAMWPHRWPAGPIAELHLLREGFDYVSTSLARCLPFLTQLPAARLAAWDLLMLSGVATRAGSRAAQLKLLEAEVLAESAAPSAATLAAVREALGSAMAVYAVKGAADDVEATQALRRAVPGVPAGGAGAATAAASWSAFSRVAWDEVVASEAAFSAADVARVYAAVLNASRTHWSPTTAPPLSVVTPPLHDGRLLPLQAGTYDAVVPLARLLLHLWVLGGRRSEDRPLVEAYDTAVESVVRQLFHTRTVTAGGYAMNFTFVASRAEALVPVATPRMCALPGLMAQGIRLGAHRYPARPSSARYTEDELLQAAEALAASCFHLYADPAGRHLRSAVYVTETGAVPGYARGGDDGGGAAAALPPRTTYCDVPALLLESYYELYQATEDALYGLWALLVMRHDTSDHCGLREADVKSAAPWRRHIRELRSLWLLFHRMDCRVYRRSRGSRGVCELAGQTLVSPVTGHLVQLPAAPTAA